MTIQNRIGERFYWQGGKCTCSKCKHNATLYHPKMIVSVYSICTAVGGYWMLRVSLAHVHIKSCQLPFKPPYVSASRHIQGCLTFSTTATPPIFPAHLSHPYFYHISFSALLHRIPNQHFVPFFISILPLFMTLCFSCTPFPARLINVQILPPAGHQMNSCCSVQLSLSPPN